MAAICVVAWGALAFGCVYPWAYWPLAAAAAAAGTAGLIVGGFHSAPVSRALIWALIAVGAAILVQLIPLPVAALGALSPRSVHLLNDLDPSFAAGLVPWHALSVWPRDTGIAVALASLSLR
jgi:hypothetical protein